MLPEIYNQKPRKAPLVAKAFATRVATPPQATTDPASMSKLAIGIKHAETTDQTHDFASDDITYSAIRLISKE